MPVRYDQSRCCTALAHGFSPVGDFEIPVLDKAEIHRTKTWARARVRRQRAVASAKKKAKKDVTSPGTEEWSVANTPVMLNHKSWTPAQDDVPSRQTTGRSSLGTLR